MEGSGGTINMEGKTREGGIILQTAMSSKYVWKTAGKTPQEEAGKGDIREGGMSPSQFGFRKGLSTVKAVEKVLSTVRETRSKWVVMVALDVKNAFNSASWDKILNKLEERNISRYIINMMDSYLSNQNIKVENVSINTNRRCHRDRYLDRHCGTSSMTTY